MLPHLGGRQMVQIWWRTGLNSQGHKSNQSVFFHASLLQWARVSLLYVRGYFLFALARVLHASGLRVEFHYYNKSCSSFILFLQTRLNVPLLSRDMELIHFMVLWQWFEFKSNTMRTSETVIMKLPFLFAPYHTLLHSRNRALLFAFYQLQCINYWLLCILIIPTF